MRPTDLRGILGYTTHFRGKIFVLSIDSRVIDHENFKNLLLDISVLRSLNVNLILVHGATTRMIALADRLGIALSDPEGQGVTDPATLEVSVLAGAQLSQKILEGLREADLAGAVSNALIAHPSGIVNGTDRAFTGRVERVESTTLHSLLESGIIPVFPPLGFDGEGHTFRVPADLAALEVARAVRASKLIFVGTSSGVRDAGNLQAQFSVAEAAKYVRDQSGANPDYVLRKMEIALKACQSGISRAHLIDGLKDEALLGELFSNEGVGTMVYANDYEAIRPALKKDIRAIRRLTQASVAEQELVPRTESDLARIVRDFFVFEIDGNVVGCVALHRDSSDPTQAELACLVVSEAHANQGIGRKLVAFVEKTAKESGVKQLFTLSTRAFNFFTQKGGFVEKNADLLLPDRKARYEKSGRNSRILAKTLA